MLAAQIQVGAGAAEENGRERGAGGGGESREPGQRAPGDLAGEGRVRPGSLEEGRQVGEGEGQSLQQSWGIPLAAFRGRSGWERNRALPEQAPG